MSRGGVLDTSGGRGGRVLPSSTSRSLGFCSYGFDEDLLLAEFVERSFGEGFTFRVVRFVDLVEIIDVENHPKISSISPILQVVVVRAQFPPIVVFRNFSQTLCRGV